MAQRRNAFGITPCSLRAYHTFLERQTGSKEFAASPSDLADHLAETTRLLAGMELKVLGLDAEDRRLRGSSEHFQERLAIAAARRYLGEDPFVFVSAFLPVESLDGMEVLRPTDLQPSLGAVSLTATVETKEVKPAVGATVEAASAETPKAEPAPPEPPQVEAAQSEAPVEVLPVEAPQSAIPEVKEVLAEYWDEDGLISS